MAERNETDPGQMERGQPWRPHRHRQARLRRCAILFQDAEAHVDPEVDVGGRLRRLRSEQGLSLRLLAEMSGLNVNTLSLIENGRTSPSVNTLQQLARALQVPIAAFFETDEAPQGVVFQKAGRRPHAAFAHGTAEDLGAGMLMQGARGFLITLHPGAGGGAAPIAHTGHEFVFGLEGQLTYTVADQCYVLETGDSLVFEARLPHCWSNTGANVTRSLLILCPGDQNEDVTQQHLAPDSELPPPSPAR